MAALPPTSPLGRAFWPLRCRAAVSFQGLQVPWFAPLSLMVPALGVTPAAPRLSSCRRVAQACLNRTRPFGTGVPTA